MEDHVAGPEEVRKAIESLTDADSIRLNRYAENRIARVGSLAGSHDADDLLQEAVLSLLEEGRRYWRPDRVNLTDFLMGTMRSIASNWARKGAHGEAPLRMTDLAHPSDDAEEARSLLGTVAASDPSPEQALINNESQTQEQLVQQIEDLVQDELMPSVVITGWKAGMKVPAIAKALDVDENELRAAQTLIRRRANARWPGGLPHVQ